ncbi:putative toxin-antitoxin system toxin component, PIN family [Bifidobacterium miconisargentati]|uniref:putative toxin-antitoxin system toxin component, PIN family n=1 Tax=Bifidobacterium miconisargentati TaxID=2834437 RepID=UPI001BDC077E|nr:putative toxin-antitoxin system toxin component, PIN family [Bifidobacterium miconisargentati]MBW3089535.1 putative toxin-antitoxin system toxin component, PIN family [Bifidobacterium miconisargentati]
MIDTNVLLSAVIFQSSNAVDVLTGTIQGPHELLLSTFTIEEARAVVSRKWPSRVDALEQYMLQLSFETVVTPLIPHPGLFEIRDPNDYPVLYSAIIGAADVFVTGDKDFTDVDIETPLIMTPAEFVRFVLH